MPKLKRPIPESDQTVVRPIAIGIVQDVLIDRLGMPSDMTVRYPGYSEVQATPHTYLSRKYEPSGFPTTDKITIDITEKPIDFLMNGNVVDAPEHIPLFLNRELELEMRPIYSSMEMSFNIRYRAKNKTEARRWYDYMLTKFPTKEDTWLHDIKYSFGIPQVYLEILKEIHRLTELQAPYGDSFDDFMMKWINPRYGYLTDQTGKNKYGVFSETQIQCLGFFDFGNEPDFGGKQNETDTWEVEIPYILRYEKPRDVYFSYPIVIHNTVLSDRYRGRTGFIQTHERARSYTWSMHHLQTMDKTNELRKPYDNHPGRYFPSFDEFMPRLVPENTMRVFTTLVLLNKEGHEQEDFLMNINDLSSPEYGFKLTDCLSSFLKEEAPYVTIPRESAMQLTLYQGRVPINHEWIEIDENLNIRSKVKLSRRKYYHIRLSVVTDWTYLSEDAKDRFLHKPCALESILQYILPEGCTIPKAPIYYDKVVDSNWFDAVADQLNKYFNNNGSGSSSGSNRLQNYAMKTVQYSKLNAVYESA